MKWKLDIVGSRNPGMSYDELETLIASIIKLDEISEILSGGAKGNDSYGKMLAMDYKDNRTDIEKLLSAGVDKKFNQECKIINPVSISETLSK